MRQRLVALALILGMVCVSPVMAGEVFSPTTHHGWLASTWEDVVSFFLDAGKDGDIDPNHEINIPPAAVSEDFEPDPELDFGPAIDPGGFKGIDVHSEAEYGPLIDPGG